MTERVPLGAQPQAVVMSLAHDHVTNLFISSYRRATVIKLDNKNHSAIEADKTLFHWE